MRTTIPCVSPLTIMTNNGEKRVVPCGECEVCRNSKRSTLLTAINEEWSKHKYVFFVTLTYADRYIPKLDFHTYSQFVSSPVGKPHRSSVSALDVVGGYDPKLRFQDAHYRLNGDFSDTAVSQALAFQNTVTYSSLAPVFERLERHKTPYIPVLNIRDLQLFMKRLRKRISDFCSTNKLNQDHETLRYFAVGEYGPLHFRPHYHVLLFLDSDEVQRQIIEYISASWTAGYSNSSLAQRGAAAYCAGYLNSFSYLPRFYTDYCRFWRPFARGSRGLGIPCDDELQEAELFADERFDAHVMSCGSTYVQSWFARSHFSRIFKKVSSFLDRGSTQLYGLLSRISEMYRSFGYNLQGKRTPKRTLKTAISTYFDLTFKYKIIGRKCYYFLDPTLYACDSIASYVSFQFVDDDSYVSRELVINRFYNICRDFAAFLKLFKYDLYNFTSVTFQRFCIMVFKAKCWRDRLDVSSMSPYFDNLVIVEQECRDYGFDVDETRKALGYFNFLYPTGERSRPFRMNRDGYLSRQASLSSSYVRMKLAELRSYFTGKVKHRMLNDRLLFDSEYMNEYGRFVFS